MRQSEEVEEKPKSEADRLSERLVQLGHEKTRLEKEIAILQIRYDDRQRLFEQQAKDAQDKMRVDRDLLERRLIDNKQKEDRLVKTQSEVNQMRAAIEKQSESQKNLLLEKEVQLDKALADAKALKEQYAKKLQEVLK